jgi:hypothetical protein
VAERTIDDLLTALDLVERLAATVDEHDQTIAAILGRLERLEQRREAPTEAEQG